MQTFRASITESQTSRRNDEGRNPEQMQSRLRLENSLVSLAATVRIAVDEPAAGPRTKNIAEQAGNVDETDDGGAEVVRRDLEEEGGDDVDCDDPGKGNADCRWLVGFREREEGMRLTHSLRRRMLLLGRR